MYLNRLNNEQKELFLDICIHAAMSNNDFEEKEKELLRQYCDEMHITTVRYTPNLSLEDAANKLLKLSSDEEMRMISLELVALVLSDNHFDEFENQFIDNFAEKIKLGRGKIAQLIVLLNNLSEAYTKINQFVLGG